MAWRAVLTARAAATLLVRRARPQLPTTRAPILPARRAIFGFGKRAPPLDPKSPEFLKQRPTAASLPPLAQGALAPSIFDNPAASPPPTDDAQGTAPEASRPAPGARPARNPATMAAVLDPAPAARRRWERKMTIRAVQRRGRISRDVALARAEREHLVKSRLLPTSVKKLYPLARQIAGQPVEAALVQMRFSRKQVAQDLRRFLEYARDQAVVARGMGLGPARQETRETEEGDVTQAVPLERPVAWVDEEGTKRKALPSRIYIDQAWVGRGPYITTAKKRARGRRFKIRTPYTSITVVLKEEVTRIRKAREHAEKVARRKPWVHHPDRPITAQRQYLLW